MVLFLLKAFWIIMGTITQLLIQEITIHNQNQHQQFKKNNNKLKIADQIPQRNHQKQKAKKWQDQHYQGTEFQLVTQIKLHHQEKDSVARNHHPQLITSAQIIQCLNLTQKRMKPLISNKNLSRFQTLRA